MLTTAIGCGEDAGAPEEREPGSIASPLGAALASARTSTERLCEVMDACYPENIEDGWCSVPSSAFERGWPHVETDVCWVPAYEKSPGAVLDALVCMEEARREMEACLASCPDDDQADRCASENDDADEACARPLRRALGSELVEQADVCEKTIRGDHEDEAL